MPNYCYNNLRFEDEAACAKARAIMESEERPFDFEKIRPMPESLRMESGTITRNAVVWYLTDGGRNDDVEIDPKYMDIPVSVPGIVKGVRRSLEAGTMRSIDSPALTSDDLMAMGAQYVSNVDEHGALTWYEWACENWGTKWNAMDASWGNDHVSFETAWAPPIPVLEDLAKELGSGFDVRFLIEADGEYVTRVSPETGFDPHCDFTPYFETSGDDDLDEQIDNRLAETFGSSASEAGPSDLHMVAEF